MKNKHRKFKAPTKTIRNKYSNSIKITNYPKHIQIKYKIKGEKDD